MWSLFGFRDNVEEHTVAVTSEKPFQRRCESIKRFRKKIVAIVSGKKRLSHKCWLKWELNELYKSASIFPCIGGRYPLKIQVRVLHFSRASFCNFFLQLPNSFLNTQNICSSMFCAVSRNFILQLFATSSIFTCNFLLQFLSSIAQNVKL